MFFQVIQPSASTAPSEVEYLRLENARLRKTNHDLHRRVQVAERFQDCIRTKASYFAKMGELSEWLELQPKETRDFYFGARFAGNYTLGFLKAKIREIDAELESAAA